MSRVRQEKEGSNVFQSRLHRQRPGHKEDIFFKKLIFIVVNLDMRGKGCSCRGKEVSSHINYAK